MSTELFRVRLTRTQVHPDDREWMPKWLDEYARCQRVSEGTLAVEQEGVLRFLRALRDRGVPAWQRLQAVRSVEWYPSLVLRRDDVDFSRFKLKPGEMAATGRQVGQGDGCGQGFAGEGLPGELTAGRPAASGAAWPTPRPFSR